MVSLLFQALLVYNYAVFLVPYTEQLRYPDWSHILGWLIASCPIIISVIAGFVHALYTAEATGAQVSPPISLSLSLSRSRSRSRSCSRNGVHMEKYVAVKYKATA